MLKDYAKRQGSTTPTPPNGVTPGAYTVQELTVQLNELRRRVAALEAERAPRPSV